MEMAKVTSKGQITIPVSIRRRLDIKEGDKLLFIDSPDGVVMVNPDTLPGAQSVRIPEIEESDFSTPEYYGNILDEAPDIDNISKDVITSMLTADPYIPADDLPSDIPSNTEFLNSNDTTAADAPEKPGARVKGVDIGALLDEIRSIGSKI